MTQREIVFRLKSIEKEQKRRKDDNKLDYYNIGEKIHQKQLKFHKCQKKNRWVFGGNRSGKTECGALFIHQKAAGQNLRLTGQ